MYFVNIKESGFPLAYFQKMIIISFSAKSIYSKIYSQTFALLK